MARAINPIFAKMADSGHAEATACFLKEEHINNIERMERKMVIPKGNERAENGSEPSGGGNSMIC